MDLFLDTNIYLAFYKFSGEDLEELEKLAVVVDRGDTVLYTTDQVRAEFARNRDSAIAEALTQVEKASVPKSFPRLLMNMPGFDQVRTAAAEYETRRAALLGEARSAAIRRELRADTLITQLDGLSRNLPLTDEIFRLADRRVRLGNPPGKNESIGDAINWEALLEGVPDDVGLLFVSGDRDYFSELDEDRLHPFLAEEWTQRKGRALTEFKTLTALFRAQYPNIRLAAELEKELAIASLVASPNFRSTHLAIQRLNSFADFTADQAKTLLDAALANSQIYVIAQDADVNTFLTSLLDRYSDQLPEEDVRQLRLYMDPMFE